MYWELWDVASRSRIADFASEAEAIQAVREILVANSPGLIDDLTLVAMYDDGESRDVELPPVLEGEKLHARLAEMAEETAADASRRVHAQIKRWLAEERWEVRDIPNPNAWLNIVVTLQSGQGLRIFQASDHLDHITIAKQLVLGGKILTEFSQIS